jgi:Transglycosylase SLT domain
MSYPWRRRAPRPPARGRPTCRAAAAYGAVAVMLVGGMIRHLPYPPPSPGHRPPQAATGAAFRQIILPDAVVIDPAGVTAARLGQLAKIPGVRDTLAVDGATLTTGGHKLNVLGVGTRQFRSWTPLHTASNAPLWDALTHGGFAASPAARRTLGLRTGTAYPLAGASTVSLTFSGTARLGFAGIGLIVSSALSARLGLIHNVAVLISAPGVAMPALRREISAVLGRGGTVVDLRPQQLPLGGGTGRPTTYLELFRASAAKYCPGLSWTVLAAIGQIESGDGANNGPSSAGALGPMQFMPGTWKVWGMTAFGERGPPNIMDPYDAVPAAARYLCASGAGTAGGLRGAIFAYNHASWYVAEVLALARQYAHAYG